MSGDVPSAREEDPKTDTQLGTGKTDRWSYLWLAIGAVLMLFAHGRWIIPLATWLAPIFILRFVHAKKLTFPLNSVHG